MTRAVAVFVSPHAMGLIWHSMAVHLTRVTASRRAYATQSEVERACGSCLAGAGLHKQVVVGKGKNQQIGYLCAWPTEEERAAIPVFTDSGEDAYWDEDNPQNSTKVAGTGLTIEVTDQTENGPIDIEVDSDIDP